MKRILLATLLMLALGLGLFADLGVRNTSAGLGVSLWLWGLLVGIAVLRRLANIDLVRGWKAMASAAALLGGAFLWRDSHALTSFALVAACGAFVLMTLRGAKPGLEECGLIEYCHAGIVSIGHATVGFPMLIFSDMRWEDATNLRTPGRAMQVARGLAITVPVIFVLGALFVGADAVFEKMVSSVFDIDLANLIGHLFFIGFVTWTVAGFLRGTFIARPAAFPYAQSKPLSLGITEVTIVLGSCIVLFALFMAVQFRYLFGGADLIQVTPSLTYAQYARRGFFELTTVVALVLPLLLVLDWLLRKERPRQVSLFRTLAAIQVVLLFAVIASAVQRMVLYQQEYGLTELRIYTTAFMGWMAVLLIWYVLTVLSGRRALFAVGAVGAAFLTILVLLALNPDDLIARTNIARSREGKQMDARYLSVLSDDAVPFLAGELHGLDLKSRAVLARNLLLRKEHLLAADWRSWSWSSYTALQALAGHEEELRAAAREE